MKDRPKPPEVAMPLFVDRESIFDRPEFSAKCLFIFRRATGAEGRITLDSEGVYRIIADAHGHHKVEILSEERAYWIMARAREMAGDGDPQIIFDPWEPSFPAPAGCR